MIAIDEAASIHLPYVRSLINVGSRLFLSSTVNGHDGTGRALSVKLVKKLRGKGAGEREFADRVLASTPDSILPANKEKFVSRM